uniref:DUF4998 domain-containing protein n=1 Tax=uncultured Draconibacterium sp. TaxID=1573823 RepID=UPI0032173448
MKNIRIQLLVLFVVTIGITSCQQMEDIHKDYIKDGETIYAGKAYDPIVLPGNGRLNIKLFFKNGGSIRNCIVEWNDGADHLSTAVTPNLPLDSIEITINDLEEKSYIFNVYNIDKEGNRSIKVPVAGSVYGDSYIQSLNNRIITSTEGGGTIDSLTIDWGPIQEGNIGVELTYLDSEGKQMTRTLLPEDNRIVIRDWESEGTLSYVTKYIPEVGAIDTFKTNPIEIALPKLISFKGEILPKDNWEIIDFSSEAWEAPVNKVIDGNYDTYWHTQYSGAQPDYPHYFIVDLKETVMINKIDAFNRNGDSRGHTAFKLYTSMDGVSFVGLGTFDNDPNSIKRSCQLDDLPVAKFVKFEAIQGPMFFTFLTELDIYGQVIN